MCARACVLFWGVFLLLHHLYSIFTFTYILLLSRAQERRRLHRQRRVCPYHPQHRRGHLRGGDRWAAEGRRQEQRRHAGLWRYVSNENDEAVSSLIIEPWGVSMKEVESAWGGKSCLLRGCSFARVPISCISLVLWHIRFYIQTLGTILLPARLCCTVPTLL